VTEILYVVEHQEQAGLWLANFVYSAPTLSEARDEREEFLGLYPYIKPRDCRIGKYECKRIERRKRKEKR
jgi:hypothetical protein